jgi:hypothetical protein
MLLRAQMMAARMVAEKMTPGGKWWQLKTMPPACHRYRAQKSKALGGNQKVGTRNACGNLVNFDCAPEGQIFDVRREISCH